jgi:hypothetical protein
MNPNTHNNVFPPSQPDEGGAPQMPAPQPTPYSPPEPPQGQGQPYGNQLPEQQYGPPASGHHEQYDFIMKSDGSRKPKSIGLPSTSSTPMRIAILGGGLVVLILAFGIFTSILNRPKVSTAELISLAQTQAELARVAAIGGANGNSQALLNSAYTISLSVGSDNRQLLIYMTKSKIPMTAKTLVLKKNPQTDARLASALTTSTFDSTFSDIIQQQLVNYQKSLKAAYNANPGPNGQKLLAAEYKSATLLLTQAQQH